MSEQTGFTFDGHAIFEAMGHIKRVGKVRTSDLGGNAVFIVESLDPAGETVTEIFNASALFRLTPVTEAVVSTIGKSVNPSPINAYDLPEKARRALLQIEREERDKERSIDAGDSPYRGDQPEDSDPFDDLPL
jgi:hypothetical protein